MKKPVIIFSAADEANFPYAVMMFNSLTKFHSPQDVDMVLYTTETRTEQVSRIPKGVRVENITKLVQEDPLFWYRQKPILSEPLLEDYELVLGLDADQIITGDLSYIFDTKDYDVGTVINWNRADPQVYGFVQGWGIQPVEYYNCGLVALRSAKFAHHWKVLCFTPQFDRLQYKEQDLLNILVTYGNYNVRCFDNSDGVAKYYAWHGIISKGEYIRAKMRPDKSLYVPQGEGDTPFPPVDMTLKVLHAGGGGRTNKMNYKTWFQDEEILKRLDELVS